MTTRLRFQKPALAVACVWLSAAGATAHQDMIIDLAPTGDLVGLPSEYQPARLDLPQSDSKATLRLGKSLVNFPTCISELFWQVPRRNVRLSASWYHDPKSLPYYLSIDLQEKRGKRGYFNGWSLLINLETAELISLERVWQTDQGWGQRGVKLDPAQFCDADELTQLVPTNVK